MWKWPRKEFFVNGVCSRNWPNLEKAPSCASWACVMFHLSSPAVPHLQVHLCKLCSCLYWLILNRTLFMILYMTHWSLWWLCIVKKKSACSQVIDVIAVASPLALASVPSICSQRKRKQILVPRVWIKLRYSRAGGLAEIASIQKIS